MKDYQYNSDQIEQWGADAVGAVLSQTDTLRRFIKENDKTPLWDGIVIIYKSSNWTKENIIGTASVQVKGKLATKEELIAERISFPVDIVDLVKYQKNFGTIFFVTKINRQDTTQHTIYYETLTPKKIRSYIKGKENQATCTIKLKKLPIDKYEIQSIFYNFYREISLGDIPPISLDELSARKDVVKITAGTTKFSPKDKQPSIIDVLLNNELFWTAELANHPTPIPIDLGTATELSITSKEGIPPIIVDGEKYDNYLSITKNKNSTIYKFGKSTTLEIPKNADRAKIKFTSSDLLSDRIKDLSFIISLIDARKIRLEGKDDINLGEIILDNPFDLDAAKAELNYYKRVDEFWKSLKVFDDFDIGNIDSNSSLDELNLLMESMNGKKSVHIDIDGDHPYYLYKKQVSNFKIILLLETVDQEKCMYKIYNYFDHKGSVKIVRGNIENISSKYSALDSDDFIELSNIDFSDILHSYKEILPLNNRIYDPANYDLLNLLLAYDKHKDHPAIILKTAKDIAGWLLEESGEILSDEIKIINYLQTVKRERELTTEENCKLYDIAEKTDNIMYKLGANLLLENYKVARLQFEELKDEEKELFKSFPIYHFWQ